MAGTVVGGKSAAEKNKAKYGQDFYQKIGSKGGRLGHTGGFASMTHEQASAAGRKGGFVSRRMGTYKVRYNGRLWSTVEVARELGISRQWVYRLLGNPKNSYNLQRVPIDN